jgi:uncharacterized Zn finger protein (UPF0148 family)
MRCPVCGGPLVNNWERGEVVCVQCGLVVDGLVDTGPERLLALRCEAIIVAAGNPSDAAESLWRVLGMLGTVML